MATTNAPDGGFRRWRRSRPFWGGLLLLLAGLELFLSANFTLGELEVHMGPEGFLSYLLPLLLVLSGVLTWVTPGQRLFYGILGLLTAVYSLVGLNLGGFALGMLLGIAGGALVVSWSPTRPQPAPPALAVAEPDDEAPPPAEHHDPAQTAIIPGFGGGPHDQRHQHDQRNQDDQRNQFDAGLDDRGHDTVPGLRPQRYEAGPDDRPRRLTELDDRPPQDQPPPARPEDGGVARKTFVLLLVPLAVTAAVLAVGSHTPARADNECPKGLPSRSATAKPSSSAPAVVAVAKKSSPAKAAVKKKTPRASGKPSAQPSPSTSASAPAGDGDSTGNPLVDGWNGLVDGVGNLLGIGEEEATPSPGPSTSTEPTSGPTSVPPASAPAQPGATPSGQPSGSPDPSGSDSGSASPSPTPSSSDIPCLGARVFKQAGPDDVPAVPNDGGLLEGDRLTMYESTYDGVVEMTTPGGPLRALKFSMDKSVTKPFSLTIGEPGGHTTLIRSGELTTDGNVRFYTPRFEGKLFGVIPVVFTPDSPPPLTLPVLWFTDVKINLAFVRCDTLTADPLRINEKA
ncbi:MAG: DUF6114 domain-containing protein [Actinoplanes sp.]